MLKIMCYNLTMSNKEKTGIYTLTGSAGNLINIVNGEVILTDESQEVVDEAINRYLHAPERSKGEYCIVKKVSEEEN